MIKKFLISALTMLSFNAFANDGIGYSSGGGIILGKTDSIAMKKEVLNVSYKKISVDYEFLNESNKVLEETIIFPLPTYGADFEMSDAYYGEPNNFIIKVNGKNVEYKTQIKATIDEKDITNSLKKIGLTDEQIAYFPINSPFKTPVKKLTDNQLKQLISHKFVDDENHVPLWIVESSYIWKQTFNPGEVLNVHHEYAPFVAAGSGFSYVQEDTIKEFCMDKSFTKSIDKLMKIKNYVPAYQVSYILKSGNSWKNGIEDFTLNINKESSQELVSLCFPGDFKKINANTLQLHLTNFKPKDDLLVYIANYDDEKNSINLKNKPIKIK